MSGQVPRDPRRTAHEILRATARGQRLDRALRARTTGLERRDRAWVRELAYGVARLRGRLDYVLNRHVHRDLDSLDAPVLDLLRSGAYQILQMDSVPAYAAVSSAVEIAREVASAGAAGLVNAVLRAVASKGLDRAAFPDRERDPVGYLAHWHSHPEWLVRRWLARWGADEVERLVEYDNSVPDLCVRPIGMDPGEALGHLDDAGLSAKEAGYGSRCLRLTAPADPARVLAAIPGVIQDPGASSVVEYVQPPPAALIADLCAAPGGKALALSETASYVLAADPVITRLRLVREAVERLGAAVGTVVAAAQAPPLARADVVLLDVPCTGTGTLARHPDARWRLGEADVGKLSEVQRRILDGAAELVPSGGVLVYSTCTLEPEENELQVDRFLARNESFALEPPLGLDEELLDERGFLRVLPQRIGFDGAFAARLRRS